MKICEKCGKQLQPNFIVCPYCGGKALDIDKLKEMAKTVDSQNKNLSAAQKKQYEEDQKNGILRINHLDGTQEEFKVDQAAATKMQSEEKDDEFYEEWIDNADIFDGHEELKKFLKSCIKQVKTIGSYVINIGKWLLNKIILVVKEIYKKFPNTVLMAGIGFTLGLIFSTIPLLGWLFGGTVTALLRIAGGVVGFFTDVQKEFLASGAAEKVIAKLNERGLNNVFAR